MNGRLGFVALVLVGLTGGAVTIDAAEMGKSMRTDDGQSAYSLKITGSAPTVAFSGDCWVRARDGNERRVAIGGTVPYARELRGHGLRCDIVQESAAGSLTVEIVGGGNKTRSRTRGARSRVRVEMR